MYVSVLIHDIYFRIAYHIVKENFTSLFYENKNRDETWKREIGSSKFVNLYFVLNPDLRIRSVGQLELEVVVGSRYKKKVFCNFFFLIFSCQQNKILF